MNPIDLLWKVLRATTNSPNDVWKPRHYERHGNVPEELLGRKVVRYTVPIKFIGNISGEDVYLVIQFCTDNLDYPYFVIGNEAFTKDLKAKQEFVYAFNVRLCKRSEFKIRHRKQLNKNGIVKVEYRRQILANAEGLIKNKPRAKLIDALLRNKKNYSYEELERELYANQFDEDEKIIKGITKKKGIDS